MPHIRQMKFRSGIGVTYVTLLRCICSIDFFNEEERAPMAETPEATVAFGVLNETSEHESRVALTPDIVTRLRKAGVTCLIESGAGAASHYVDADYVKAGAQVVSAADVIARADVLGFVDRPSNELLSRVQTERKLLIRSSRPPAAEGKFLISHKYIAAVNDGTECPIHHTAYIPSLVIGAQHMI